MLVLEFAKKICLYVSLLRNPIGYIFQVLYFSNVVAKTYLILEMWHLKIFFISTVSSDQHHIKQEKKILLRSLEYLQQSLIACFCASTCKLEEQCIYRDKKTGEKKQDWDMPKSWDYSRRRGCQRFELRFFNATGFFKSHCTEEILK